MDKKEELEKLKKEMEADDSLPLKTKDTRLVFGDGNPEAKILCVGEGPGYHENQKGLPFVGNAGALLNFLIRMIGMKREEVYITNIVHHRPPENRDPEPSEIEAYKPYLDKIIEIIDPKLIVTLGRFSMAKFMPGVFISTVHGKERKVTFKGKSVIVVPMYHPAAALRSLDVKAKLTEDFKRIPELLKLAENLEEEKPKVEKKDKQVEQMNLI